MTEHPAKFSAPILEVITDILHDEFDRIGSAPLVVDPFAGIGGIEQAWPKTIGVELEPEWAVQGERVMVGDALALPFASESIQIVSTSPCLEQSHRLLTSDLRWVAAGDIKAGDEVMAFDEDSPGIKANGHAKRRKWQRATVLSSIPRRVRCVRVVLENDEEFITTPEHPWLSEPYSYGGRAADWTASKDLAGRFVLRQVEPWRQRTSFDAGWLSGMFDGEGSLSLGVHGAPKLVMSQVEGPVMDKAFQIADRFRYNPNLIPRKNNTGRPVTNLYVTGGFPGLMQALGELRPVRLIDKWETLDVSTRSIQPVEKVKVVEVVDAGLHDIQEIETSTGTYIGEGYLHHNCYGNRMADHHEAKEKCRPCGGTGIQRDRRCERCDGAGRRSYDRITYRHKLGRLPTEGSSAVMPWGPVYRDFHAEAWREVHRVLQPEGLFILNIGDHIRNHKQQRVSAWHGAEIRKIGFTQERRIKVVTRKMKKGANRDARVPYEWVITFRKV